VALGALPKKLCMGINIVIGETFATTKCRKFIHRLKSELSWHEGSIHDPILPTEGRIYNKKGRAKLKTLPFFEIWSLSNF
jgi:hypothetical protein